jgi:hypothetical protein
MLWWIWHWSFWRTCYNFLFISVQCTFLQLSRPSIVFLRMLKAPLVVKFFRLLPSLLLSNLVQQTRLPHPRLHWSKVNRGRLQGAVRWVPPAYSALCQTLCGSIEESKRRVDSRADELACLIRHVGGGSYAAVCFCPQQHTRYVTHAFASRSQTHTASPFRLKQTHTITHSFH